jgi:signal peptidase I
VLLLVAGMAFWGKGYRLYAVRTGSMTPTYPTGSLVIDRPASSDRLQPGTVITFRVGSELVTHRLVATGTDGLQTRGDANRTADPWRLPARNVVGEVVGGLRHGGYVLVFLHQPTGVPSLVLLVVSILLAWQLFFGAPAPDREDGDGDQSAPPARHGRSGGPALVAAAVVAVALGLPVAAAGSWVGVGSTGAYFTDSVTGSMTFDLGCDDTHEHGNGPDNGNGHEKCHGNGHTKDRTDQPTVLDVTD